MNTPAAERAWPSPDAPDKEWVRFSHYPNRLAACIVSGLLESEGVHTIVEHSGIFGDTEPSTIWIPKGMEHRARWILALMPPSDNELTFLAIGELKTLDAEPSAPRRPLVLWVATFIMAVVFAGVAGTVCLSTGRWCGF